MTKPRHMNDRGPIAQSYDELQGISAINAAFESGRTGLSLDELTVRTCLQCLVLIELNCAELCARQLHAMAGRSTDLSSAHQHSLWHVAITMYATQMLDHAARHSFARHTIAPPASSTTDDYMARYAELAEYLATFFQHGQIHRRVSIGQLSEPVASIAHDAKNLFLLTQAILYKRHALRVPDRATESTYLDESTLRDAFSTPSLHGDTYFSQFRLLHQIPELLARNAHVHADAALDPNTSPTRFCLLLKVIVEHTRLIRQTIPCMLQLMTPREYHEIRENLGMTSGSHSAMLRGILFGTDLRSLCERGDAISVGLRGRNADLGTLIRSLVLELQHEVLSWRDAHLGFPRNLLGGFETRSLIGSKDAVATVASMREESLTKPPLSSLSHARGAFRGDTLPAAVKQLDELLLKITADQTQARFRAVQERTGPVFGKQTSSSQDTR